PAVAVADHAPPHRVPRRPVLAAVLAARRRQGRRRAGARTARAAAAPALHPGSLEHRVLRAAVPARAAGLGGAVPPRAPAGADARGDARDVDLLRVPARTASRPALRRAHGVDAAARG